MGSIEKNISSDIFFSISRTGCQCRPGGHALVELHVEPPPQLRVMVKLDGAGVVAQEPQQSCKRDFAKVSQYVEKAPTFPIQQGILALSHMRIKHGEQSVQGPQTLPMVINPWSFDGQIYTYASVLKCKFIHQRIQEEKRENPRNHEILIRGRGRSFLMWVLKNVWVPCHTLMHTFNFWYKM